MTRKMIGSNAGRPRPEGELLRLSSEATNHYVPMITDRDDIVVVIADGAGDGSPAAFMPGLGEIEVDAKYLGIDPEKISMRKYGWKQKAPAFTGLLIHEAAGHAQHSLWATEKMARREGMTRREASYLNAAILLEESRIECLALQERPQDYLWLQASATDIALKELGKQFAENTDKITATRMAALIMARVDGGSIDDSPDIQKVRSAIIDQVGDDTYEKMRQIWLEAHQTADDDTDGMLALGRRWVELTGDEGDEGEITPGMAGGSEMEQALGQLLGRIAGECADEASGAAAGRAEESRMKQFVGARRTEGQQQQEAEKEAAKVFHAGPNAARENPYNALHGFRPPKGEERRLASVTRKQLESVFTRERAVLKTTSPKPPGRVSMRGAMKGQALRDVGLVDTSEPFKRKQRLRTHTPPLAIGIIQDASGSQDRAAAAAASGAWALATAASQLDAKVAMVTFGNATTRIIAPGEKLSGVPVITANSGNHKFSWGVKALEGVLNLMNPSNARLLVILTDGHWEGDEMQKRDAILKRYVDAGVHVMWMITDGGYGNPVFPKVHGVNVVKNDYGSMERLPEIIAKGASETLMKEVGM